ncbi:Cytidine and deoxycytidylate deaminase zinc-binding region [Bosea lathyri]|uniref:Cytidine and deoxycytidylate deaminase zinc-binding region n=1 Tax=Bosea lathyri TaxID=1036778 RepID=A0A1H6AE14_9HYPH|nr:Cytidine and deoxycytidylate deaminase zinc-binding region [Bosea lathyri]
MGFAGPIGSNMEDVILGFKKYLKIYDFEPIVIHITDGLQDLYKKDYSKLSYNDRYDGLIELGNETRKDTDLKDIMARLAFAAIDQKRSDLVIKPRLKRVAYLIRQIKRPEEIDVFRKAYGRSYYTIYIYSDVQTRLQRVYKSIKKKEKGRIDEKVVKDLAQKLIDKDEFEEENDYGQKLRDAFPLADAFIDSTVSNSINNQVDRFCKLLFGTNFESPTRDEYGMYMAKSASLRSLDLSRQVGAAIFSLRGEVHTLGCNEVPSLEGGTYWSGDSADSREYTKGYDTNDDMKIRMLDDVLLCLKEQNALTEEFKDTDGKTLLKRIQVSEFKFKYKNLIMMDTIEFGRIIHAEMNAITDAARNGVALKNSIMFCTTFPCHLCAKHIIASGIKRVVFIEPYPKSYALELYADEIIVAKTTDKGEKRIKFEPFTGIAPYRYRELFERRKRKDGDGNAQEWKTGKPEPIHASDRALYISYIELEKAYRDEGFAAILIAVMKKKSTAA